jgi:type IV pilus assembly protein PilW
MIALALGLFLVAGVISIFVTNRQAFRTTEQLSRMQENARTAFELMSRSLREAGGTPCGRGIPTGNVINNAATTWWANWADGLRGYDDTATAPGVTTGTGAAQRVSGTDALFAVYADANTGNPITSHNPPAASFQLNSTGHGLANGDIVLACDYRQAAIFQITNVNVSNSTVVHNTGASVSPGNCSVGLGVPTTCTATGTAYAFQGGHLVRLVSELWYVGNNGRGGRSLYRARLFNNAGVASIRSEEIAEGVTNMQITYLEADTAGVLADQYVAAGSVSSWPLVVATRITLTLQSTEAVGTDGSPLQRQMIHVVSLRNRLP